MLPDKRIQDFFREYRQKALQETYLQRRAVHRTVGQQRAFLKGEPADWFDPYNWRWRSFEDHPKHDSSRVPKYRHHLDIYGMGWKVLQSAIQTVGIPGSTFRPQNPKQQRDKDAARIAKPIIDYERSVIDYQGLWGKIFRYFYTDGVALAYPRHISNSRKYGQGTMRQEVEVPDVTQEQGYKCFNCDGFTPSGMTVRDEIGQVHCPECDEPFHEENFIPEEIGMVKETEISTIPKGEEVVEIYGALECPLPWWAGTLDDCPYIPVEIEVPKESIAEVFTELEEKIMNASAQDNEEDVRIRASVRAPFRGYWQNSMEGFRTYGRWWFRPETFYGEKRGELGGVREELLRQFPEGAFVQFADSVVLDAIPERPEDKVVIAHALDGDGMYRPSLGQPGVPINEAADTSFNQKLEAQEFADFPPILFDKGTIAPGLLENTPAVPGFYKGIVVPPGKNLDGSVKQIDVKSVGQQSESLLEASARWMELLVGTSPALAGGQMTNTRSAEQYELAKNQSLQRLAPPYESAKRLIAKIDEILVHEFLTNRTDKEFEEIVAERVNQREMADLLAPRQGRVIARAEQSESIPQTWAQKQSALTRLLASQNQFVQQAFADSNVLQLVFDSMGLPELKVRAKSLWDKYERVIDLLLQSAPAMQLQPNPLDEFGPPVPMLMPSVPFEPLFDDPQILMLVAAEWAATPEGIEAAMAASTGDTENQGFANVKAYVQQAALAMARAVDQTAPPPQKQLGPAREEEPAGAEQ